MSDADARRGSSVKDARGNDKTKLPPHLRISTCPTDGAAPVGWVDGTSAKIAGQLRAHRFWQNRHMSVVLVVEAE